MLKSLTIFFFLTFFNNFNAFSQAQIMELSEVKKEKLNNLDKLYPYIDKDKRELLHEPWKNILTGFGNFLNEKKLKWNDLKVFNTFYFNENGSIDYYFYHFQSEILPQHKELYKKYAQEFFGNYNLGILGYNKKLFQCGGSVFQFLTKKEKEDLEESKKIKGIQNTENNPLEEKAQKENLKKQLTKKWFLKEIIYDTTYWKSLTEIEKKEALYNSTQAYKMEYIRFLENDILAIGAFNRAKDTSVPFHIIQGKYDIDFQKKQIIFFSNDKGLSKGFKTYPPNQDFISEKDTKTDEFSFEITKIYQILELSENSFKIKYWDNGIHIYTSKK